ncbi:MAG: ThuA domain-containing protein [Candidatus Sumerlaeota bacterium]|nr:ThuA domain-containing protein [Candidatus Sumerlaeota bacterium]
MNALKVFAVCLSLNLLAGFASAADPVMKAKLSVLIIDGMNNHDWERATQILMTILQGCGRFNVVVSTTPPPDATKETWAKWQPEFSKYDVVISNYNSGFTSGSLSWPRETEKSLEDYVSSGGGLVIYHSANNSFPNWRAYNEMIGLGWRDKSFGPSLIIGPDEKVVVIPKGEGRNPGHGPEHD